MKLNNSDQVSKKKLKNVKNVHTKICKSVNAVQKKSFNFL